MKTLNQHSMHKELNAMHVFTALMKSEFKLCSYLLHIMVHLKSIQSAK